MILANLVEGFEFWPFMTKIFIISQGKFCPYSNRVEWGSKGLYEGSKPKIMYAIWGLKDILTDCQSALETVTTPKKAKNHAPTQCQIKRKAATLYQRQIPIDITWMTSHG